MNAKASTRESNFELLRIAAMFLVLIVHADFLALGSPNQNDINIQPISSCMRFITESLALVCVNVYVMISGYFGIKTNLRGFLKFIFIVIFWRITSISIASLLYTHNLSLTQIPNSYECFKLLIPGYEDWFVRGYIMLMIFAPLLNSFISKSTTRQLGIFTLSYVLFEVIFNWLVNIYPDFERGGSILSFIGLYLIGSLIQRTKNGKLIKNILKRKFCLSLYLAISIIIGCTLFFIAYIWSENSGIYNWSLNHFWPYNSPIVIICSVLLFLYFSKINIKSRFINKVAISTFAVYLFHMNPLLINPYLEICRYLFNSFDTFTYLIYISLFIISIFSFAIVFDRIRILLWDILNKYTQKSLLTEKQ